MPAVKAIQLEAVAVGTKIMEKLLMETAIGYIQSGERAENHTTEISEKCIYNRLTGEFVATNKKWFDHELKLVWPRPFKSAQLQISGIDEISGIIAHRRKAENVRFDFVTSKIESCVQELVDAFFKHCKGLTHSNVYGLRHADFDIIIDSADEYLAVDEGRQVQLILRSYKALKFMSSIPVWDDQKTITFFNVTFSAGFCSGPGSCTIDLGPYVKGQMIRKLQFHEPNLLGPYAKQVKCQLDGFVGEYGFAEVISAVVDADHLVNSSFPFDYLMKTMLRFLLLHGVYEVPASWDMFTKEPDTKRCYEALGLERATEDETAICLSTSKEQNRFKFGKRCLR